jgi:hypothetical protein
MHTSNTENEFAPLNIYVKVLKTRNVHLDYNDRIVELMWDRVKISEPFTAGVLRKTEFQEVK